MCVCVCVCVCENSIYIYIYYSQSTLGEIRGLKNPVNTEPTAHLKQKHPFKFLSICAFISFPKWDSVFVSAFLCLRVGDFLSTRVCVCVCVCVCVYLYVCKREFVYV